MADIIDEVIAAEGGDRFTNNPNDAGGPTKFGITAATLGQWRKLNRPTTAIEVEALEEPEARAIYTHRYISAPHFDQIPFTPLRDQLIDYGVNAGPEVPIRNLQHILGVDRDGDLGPETLAALALRDSRDVNNKLVALRELFYRSLASHTPRDKTFLKGWLARAHRFFLP